MAKEVYIPRRSEIVRAVYEKALTSIPYFKSEIINPERIEGAREILQEMGLCIVANHFSRKETAQIFEIPFKDPELRKRKIIAPVAAHQRKFWMRPLSRLPAVDLRYLVTEDTIKTAEEKGKPIPAKNEGLREFTNDALQVMTEKGVMILFPQGSRRDRLYSPDTPNTVGRLMLEAKRKKIRMGFMFVGVDLVDDVEDYSKVSGYNWRSKYKLTIGNSNTDEQLLEEAGRDFRRVDEVVYRKLERLVSPKYANAIRSPIVNE